MNTIKNIFLLILLVAAFTIWFCGCSANRHADGYCKALGYDYGEAEGINIYTEDVYSCHTITKVRTGFNDAE